MNVTREVVTDLLPVYFSGDASRDTKALVEDYFRQDPDFERIARSAATPLETLQAPAPIAAGPEKEKRDLESIRWGLRRRQLLFAGSLLLTLLPLSYYFTFTHGHLVSLTVRDPHWDAAFGWSLAMLFWFIYFARLQRRTVALVVAISLTLIPIPFVLHSVFAGGSVVWFVIQWIVAAIAWIKYFRQRP
jgi:hypothetical protein